MRVLLLLLLLYAMDNLKIYCSAHVYQAHSRLLLQLIQESCAIAKMTARCAWPRTSGSNEPLRIYGHSKLSKMAACRQLGFDVNGNSAIRPADPENPTLEPNMMCIGSPVCCGDMAIRVSWGHMEPPFWGRGGRRGSAMAPFERAMLVSYRL